MTEKKDVTKTETDKHVGKEKEPTSISTSSFVGYLALVIAAACAIGLFVLWNNAMMNQKKAADLNPEIEHLRLVQANLQNSIEQQQHSIKNLEDNISNLREKTGRDEDGWALAEVDYIVRLANFNVEFEKNVALAIKLLKIADEKIHSLGNPKLASLRMAIQKNISALSSVPQVDTEGLVIRLQVLSKTVESLPLAKQEESGIIGEVSEKQIEKPANWKDAFENSMKSIKEMVVIRRLDKPLKALMQPDQHANLVENIQLQLSAAQWAVLHHESKIYQASLKLAKEWVGEYIQKGDQVNAVIKSIDDLLAIDIDPPVPAIDVEVKKFTNSKTSENVDAQKKTDEVEQPKLQQKQVEVLSS